mmetsp:Transcript_115313/g.229812  ORF Transcript_115313/g.229812 Transcript_115313/m.229812 type:complete len:214 (+) Transcript_115313:209-850(+)
MSKGVFGDIAPRSGVERGFSRVLHFGHLLREPNDGSFDLAALDNRLWKGDPQDTLFVTLLDAHVEAVLVEPLHLGTVTRPCSNQILNVALDRILMVVVHVGHDRLRERKARVDCPLLVFLRCDATSHGETAHKGDVQDLLHAEHVEVAELNPVGSWVFLEVLFFHSILIALWHSLNAACEHNSCVRCSTKTWLGDAKARACIRPNIPGVAGHA